MKLNFKFDFKFDTKGLILLVSSLILMGCGSLSVANTESEVTLRAINKHRLNPILEEVSGLAQTKKRFWAINDSGGEAALYGVQKKDVKQFNVVTIKGAVNIDWEDLAQDNAHIYIADNGDNFALRANLTVYKVLKNELINLRSNGEVDAQQLTLKYRLKDNYFPRKKHNYDSEALSVVDDKLWLFSKNRIDAKTELYILDKNENYQLIEPAASFDVKGLITAADYHPAQQKLLLLGYSRSAVFGHSFIWLVDVKENQLDWDSAKRFKIKPYAQWESVQWTTNNRFILGAESSALSKAQIAEFELPK